MKLALLPQLVLAVLIILPLAQTSHAGDPNPEPEATLRLGTVAPGGTPWSRQLKRAKNRIKEESEKRIKVKVYLGGKLGSEASLVRRCQSGKVGGIAVSVGALGNAVPELYATELPYLWSDEKAAYKALDASIPLVKELMAAKGFIFYMWGENGYRHFASKQKFFESPSDLRGMKMRSQPAMPHVEMYKALGASASPIAVGEVTSSLANDVVTGYDNTLLYAFATQWHKEVKYVTLSSHIYQPAVVVWCKPWFDTLAPDLQAVLLRVPAGEQDRGRNEVRAMNTVLKTKYEEAGVKVKVLTAAQKGAFKSAASAVEAKFLSTTSAKGKQLLAILKR